MAEHFDPAMKRPQRYAREEIEDVRVLVHWLYAHREAIERLDWKPDDAPDVFATQLLAVMAAT